MSVSALGTLVGKVAIVTASTDGIGFAIARRLAQGGASVVVSSRKEANVQRATEALKAEGLSVHGLKCHVGKEEDRQNLITETVKKFGAIDILVSNAAVNPHFGSILDCSGDAWDKIFDINVKCSFLLSKEVVPHMEKRGGGAIVYISSIAGYHAMPGLGAYSISKTALLGLTRALAKECSDINVRVNCVAPGIIDTSFSSVLTGNEAIKEKMLEQIPLKRIGLPKDIGGIVAFLCSDEASYVTGENIVVAGGMESRL